VEFKRLRADFAAAIERATLNLFGARKDKFSIQTCGEVSGN